MLNSIRMKCLKCFPIGMKKKRRKKHLYPKIRGLQGQAHVKTKKSWQLAYRTSILKTEFSNVRDPSFILDDASKVVHNMLSLLIEHSFLFVSSPGFLETSATQFGNLYMTWKLSLSFRHPIKMNCTHFSRNMSGTQFQYMSTSIHLPKQNLRVGLDYMKKCTSWSTMIVEDKVI